ncbi:hypothetical protein GCM10025864_10980 [Luteimicrobium album]|uniref:Uncharacterized protein n=1 Tax=Luteimicrobium album TaxID=1054550 RepID=A0ABQ6I050_9MICO|nr:hypothetical protein GCM10025864_10980 [Luteimicrobium album]
MDDRFGPLAPRDPAGPWKTPCPFAEEADHIEPEHPADAVLAEVFPAIRVVSKALKVRAVDQFGEMVSLISPERLSSNPAFCSAEHLLGIVFVPCHVTAPY